MERVEPLRDSNVQGKRFGAAAGLCASLLLVPLLILANQHGTQHQTSADGVALPLNRAALFRDARASRNEAVTAPDRFLAFSADATTAPAQDVRLDSVSTPAATAKRATTTPTTRPKPRPTTTTTAKPKPTTTTTTAPRHQQSGEASYYQTYNGTCAHKSLPLGTIVTVTNLANGLSVTCRVADRGPYVGGRIIDLDKETFQQLSPSSTGVIEVRISW